MTPTEKRVINLALRYVKNCPEGNKSRHVSLIFYKNFAITYGINHEGAYVQSAHGYIHNSLHSEYDCIRRFKRKNLIDKLSECELWNVRLSRKNELRNSRPCSRCRVLLSGVQFKKIHYSTDYGGFECL